MATVDPYLKRRIWKIAGVPITAISKAQVQEEEDVRLQSPSATTLIKTVISDSSEFLGFRKHLIITIIILVSYLFCWGN